MNPKIILVTGATGQQGGAVAKHLLEKGWRLRALVRDPEKPSAISLHEKGVEIIKGDYDDRHTLDFAMQGVYGAYSVQSLSDVKTEIRHGKAVADAAKTARVKHFVYSSVAGVDQNTGIPHFESKLEIEKYIKSIGLPATVLRPVFFMENFNTRFKKQIAEGKLSLPLHPTTQLQMIAVNDIGAFASMAFGNPKKYIGKELEIAGDELSMIQVRDILEKTLMRSFIFDEQPLEELRKWNKDIARMYEWFREKGYSVNISKLRKINPSLMTFESWVKQTLIQSSPIV